MASWTQGPLYNGVLISISVQQNSIQGIQVLVMHEADIILMPTGHSDSFLKHCFRAKHLRLF